MLRKLLVTLAGAGISDPYLQIIAALMILIISFGLQSFFQPYEPIALDVLDSLGIFCLLCTQILSILYLYVDTSSTLVVNKTVLEYTVTFGLFLMNGIALISFLAGYVIAYLQLDWWSLRCKKREMLWLVEDIEVFGRELAKQLGELEESGAAGGAANEETNEEGRVWYFWKHPTNGKVMTWPPKRARVSKAGDGTTQEVLWVWYDENGNPESTSFKEPQLLERAPIDETREPLPGDRTCLFDFKRMEATPLRTIPRDLGGLSLCCKVQAIRAHKPRGVALTFALTNPAALGDTRAGQSIEMTIRRSEPVAAPDEAELTTIETPRPASKRASTIESAAAPDAGAAATKIEIRYTPSWWDTQGIELGDEVRHPKLGEGVVVEIDYDDTGLVQLEFEAHDTIDGTHQQLRRLDFDLRDWTTLSQSEGFDIARPTGCVDAAAARLQRDLNEAHLRGDEAGIQMLRLELKALTLPSAIKDSLREIRRLMALTGGNTDGAAGEGGEEEEEAGGAEDALADSMDSGDNWFYADDDDEDVLHGPYSVAQLQEWVDDGHFAHTDLVRNGRTGELVELAKVAAVVEGAAAVDESVAPAVVHPRGWSEHDDGDGNIYYNNDHTGKTTFTKPTLPAAPEGWSVHAHGDDGQYYFENDAGDGESQWHHPHDDDPRILQPEETSSSS